MPDAENPKPMESEDIEDPKAPTELSTEEYNQLADAYLEELVTKLEGEAEKNPAVDVEYSVKMTSLSNSHMSTNEMVGWRARSQRGRQRHLCPQQAAPEQADLAQLPNIWTEALRLGCHRRVDAPKGGRRIWRLDLSERRIVSD